MANWLAKFLSSAAGSRNLPALRRDNQQVSWPAVRQPDKLPNASVVYGVGASALLVIGIYFLFMGRWFTGIVIFMLAACLLGFAVHIMKHSG